MVGLPLGLGIAYTHSGFKEAVRCNDCTTATLINATATSSADCHVVYQYTFQGRNYTYNVVEPSCTVPETRDTCVSSYRPSQGFPAQCEATFRRYFKRERQECIAGIVLLAISPGICLLVLLISPIVYGIMSLYRKYREWKDPPLLLLSPV